MTSRIRFLGGVACSLAMLSFSTYASADEGDTEFSAQVSLGSDMVFRGVSQTLGGAAIEAYADVATESGLYGYVWASNVDFVPDNEPDDGATFEIDAVIGYYASFNDRWSADLSFTHYMYPDAAPGVDLDYSETIAALWLDEQHHVTVGYSNDVFGEDASAWYYAVGTSHELPMEFQGSLEFGYYDLNNAYGASYSYIEAGLSRPLGPVTLSLAYYDTFGEAEEIFYRQSIGPRFVLSIDIDLVNVVR